MYTLFILKDANKLVFKRQVGRHKIILYVKAFHKRREIRFNVSYVVQTEQALLIHGLLLHMRKSS